LEVFRSYYDPRVSKVVEKNIGINSVDYSVSDVAFSPSGNSAVFCSNTEGGSGKADIFLAEVFRDKKTGKLTLVNPVNLGAKVNTMLSETNPMFVTEQIIAFASNGHIGYGGKDIYFYNLLNSEFRNAGPAINSPFDEFCPARKGDRFYFSSNRQGKFKNRFYACALPDSLLENWIVPPYVPEVVPEEPVLPPPVVVNNDAVIVDVLQNIQNSSTQKYQYAQALSFLLLTDSARQQKIQQADSTTDYKEYRFLTIYHPQNDLRIETGFEKELDLLADLLNKRKDWGVEVRSHTDSRGSMQLNASLSQRRAKYITDYLIAKGVNPAQVKPIGFGESLPVNHCSDGVECTEDEYRQNRRTEFVLTPKIFWTKSRGKGKSSLAPATRATAPPAKAVTPPSRAAVPTTRPNSTSSSGTRSIDR
jgi:outer membrane protein OmpA-like peptidoglycan-associated protein